MKILVSSTDSMMIQFLIPHVKKLIADGHQVDIACSIVKGRMEEIKKALPESVNIFTVNLARSPIKPSNLKGLKELKKIIADGNYNFVWTNEPVMGVMTRLAARKHRKNGLKVMYMAHGFHFFKGAPKLNWLIFYPIEKFMARYTDILVTINQMDYELAKEKFTKIKNIYKVHGTGVDFSRLDIEVDRESVRAELGLADQDYLIMSVGELNENKNQKVIIEAINLLNDKSVKYFMAGIGDQQPILQEKVEKYGLTEQVKFLGYTKEVGKYLHVANAFAFPSYREGLGLASLEAMHVGLPILTSNRHGINDYSINKETGFKYHPDDAKGFAEGIKMLKADKELSEKISLNNKEVSKNYEIKNSIEEISKIIRTVAN